MNEQAIAALNHRVDGLRRDAEFNLAEARRSQTEAARSLALVEQATKEATELLLSIASLKQR